jgi:hypothetical protein
MIAVGCGLVLPRSHGLYPVLTHQPPDTPVADLKTQFLQFFGHAWSAITGEAEPVPFADSLLWRQDRG